MTNNGHVPQPGGYEQVESEGHTWKLAWVGPGIKKDFTAWLRAVAWERLEEDAPEVGDPEFARRKRRYDRREALLNEAMANGAYHWDSPLDGVGMGSAVAEALGQATGQVKLAQLMLRPYHGELSIAQIQAAFAGAPKLFERALERCLDPNRSAPAEAAGDKTLMETPCPGTEAA